MYEYDTDTAIAAIERFPLRLPSHAEANTTEGYTFQRWAYLGEMAWRKGKSLERRHVWLREDGEKMVWGYRGGLFGTSASPGTVYAVHAKTEDGSTHASWGGNAGPFFLGRIDDAQAVAWEAAHRAALGVARNRNTEKAETRRKLLAEALEPVREAYWNTNAQGRAALLADLITYVTKGY